MAKVEDFQHREVDSHREEEYLDCHGMNVKLRTLRGEMELHAHLMTMLEVKSDHEATDLRMMVDL